MVEGEDMDEINAIADDIVATLDVAQVA